MNRAILKICKISIITLSRCIIIWIPQKWKYFSQWNLTFRWKIQRKSTFTLSVSYNTREKFEKDWINFEHFFSVMDYLLFKKKKNNISDRINLLCTFSNRFQLILITTEATHICIALLFAETYPSIMWNAFLPS